MRSASSPLLLLLALAVPLPAQVIGITFENDNDARRYRKWMQQVNGRPMLVGEALSGLDVDMNTGILRKRASADRVALLVPDPARPDLLLYEIGRDGRRRMLSRRRTVDMGKDVLKHGIKLHWVLRYENLYGLHQDYLRRKKRVDELQEKLEAIKLGEPEWFEVYRKTLTEIDALAAWLRETVFPRAARKLQSIYKAKLKRLQDASSQTRLERHKNSLTDYEPPKRLLMSLSEKGAGGKWFGRQTSHLRLIAHGGVTAGSVDESLLLGERIIEGFRSRFVEPLLGPEDEDPVGDDLFVEFFLAPDNVALWNHIWTDYYGKSLPYRPEGAPLPSGYNGRFGTDGVEYVRHWRFKKDSDLQGIVANSLGQVLANRVYNRDATGSAPAWVIQGWGYWISFEYLSRNTVTTLEWRKGDYARAAPEAGEKPLEQGLRATFNERAVAHGRPMRDVFRMQLTEMNAVDLAKSWSVLDWLIVHHPDKLDPFLKASCRATGRNSRTNLEELRPKAEELFDVDGKTTDVYKRLDEMWMKVASQGQEREGG